MRKNMTTFLMQKKLMERKRERSGKNGMDQIETSSLICAEFLHCLQSAIILKS